MSYLKSRKKKSMASSPGSSPMLNQGLNQQLRSPTTDFQFVCRRAVIIPTVVMLGVLFCLRRLNFISDFSESEVQYGQTWEPPTGVVFTPEEFIAGRHDKYVNLPVLPESTTYKEVQNSVAKAIARPVGKPHGLMHLANPPGNDVVMGLAAYPTAMGILKKLVGSLRSASGGYDGHIILGVHSQIPLEEQEYLKKMDVTFYAVEFVSCDESIQVKGNNEKNVVRGLCAKGLEKLKLEWSRFEMCRQWLHACKTCTGWALVLDTRDVFFQANPFLSLPPPNSSPYDLLFIEEISKHTCPKAEDPNRYFVLGNSNYRPVKGKVCYGAYHKPFQDRPVLCSGTIIGTRKGVDRFLAVFVQEFYDNNAKTNLKCRSPYNTDQMTLQYLYYYGRFGEFERTKTSPWGTGPVNTIGKACVDKNKLLPKERDSALDLTEFDNTTGLILNTHEGPNSLARISPLVHQFDRCRLWIQPFFHKHPELF
eukprot:CAMPEP_0198288646 /NCGR_PEP_ID=MMETSP1449-20131203/7081_1 /TAXON_ID=420275 /ORGANISM="Attheya septentrionalis, Strain CCMP2084" /LENGTH=477 /DNA_ID=CAMNT_0043986827 /DNA_START=31 /DNA_END=1461 /DNA_ORIENTATION=+